MRHVATVLSTLVLLTTSAHADPVSMQIFQTATAPAPLMVSLFSPSHAEPVPLSITVDLFHMTTETAPSEKLKVSLPQPVNPPVVIPVRNCVNGNCYVPAPPPRFMRQRLMRSRR